MKAILVATIFSILIGVSLLGAVKASPQTGNSKAKKIREYTLRYWRATLNIKSTQKRIVILLLGHKSNQQIYECVQLSHVYFGG